MPTDPEIEHLLRLLTPLEKKVIKLRYGLYDGYVYTYKEIALIVGYAPRVVRAIEQCALDILKNGL